MSRGYDVVVVGSGIAGLYAALLAAPWRRVLLVSKGALEESNTRYAQGGIAAAMAPQDSPELHLRDTIAAGDGLCDPEQVAILTREAPRCIADLLAHQVPFDRDGDRLAFTREAAHSLPRVLHAGGDATGASIERSLAMAVREARIAVEERALCTSLLRDGGRVRGVRLLRDGAEEAVEVTARYVILATGGAGQLFARTTNPAVATGDGLAIAYRAGAELMDLELVQFHPTALVLEGAPPFLISEAVRGEGGILRDGHGRAFMADHHPDRELAPRDVVARAIHQQMSRTGDTQAWLDITHLPAELIERRFPTIVRFCRGYGIDPVCEPIPVAPAAHYLMGGIRTDSWARTSLPGLFACGEVACTGVHGANRLASNSLLEGLVFARRAAQRILSGEADAWDDEVIAPEGARERSLHVDPGILPLFTGRHETLSPALRLELADVLWQRASVVRSAESLRGAQTWIENAVLTESAAGHDTAPEIGSRREHETANLFLLGSLLLQSALLREESRGAHFRTDFPEHDPAWRGHLVVSREGVRFAPLAEERALAGRQMAAHQYQECWGKKDVVPWS